MNINFHHRHNCGKLRPAVAIVSNQELLHNRHNRGKLRPAVAIANNQESGMGTQALNNNIDSSSGSSRSSSNNTSNSSTHHINTNGNSLIPLIKTFLSTVPRRRVDTGAVLRKDAGTH